MSRRAGGLRSGRVIPILLGSVFFFAGLLKLIAPQAGNTVYWTMIGVGNVAHYAFCSAEVSLGIWLVSGWKLRLSSAAAVLAFSSFLVTIAVELAGPAPKPCGCMGDWGALMNIFGVRTQLIMDLTMNVALTLLASDLLWREFHPTKQDSRP